VTNPWVERRIVAYAHQGGSFEGPSSTLYAVRAALAAGATAIELDVHATADRALVVCHDETVNRTTNHRGEIAHLSLAEIREMDNAYWWIPGDAVTPGRAETEYPWRGRAPADRAFGVATLEEIVAATPGVPLNLDIKRTTPEVEPYEALLAGELRRLAITDRVVVASFSDAAIHAFRAVAPEVRTSAATDETANFYFALHGDQELPPLDVCAFQVPATFGEITVVDEAFVAAAHGRGIAVHVWTINDEAEMNHLIDLGVDGIITDRPSVLVNLLATRGCGWDGAL
jgi:glycerophosphoryl diester phosphodiesterase